jgi:hypothetical protein
MGYDHHITRADHWMESENDPITRAEWAAYATAHPGLRDDGYVDWLDIGREPTYEFVDRFGNVMALTWHNDQVYVYGFNGEDLSGLLAMAAELGGRFVGDEGEGYNLYGSISEE